jgi:hypothetical protein
MTQLEEAISLFGWSVVKDADSSRAVLYSARQPREVAIAARELRQNLSDVKLAKAFIESLEPELKNALLCALIGETGIKVVKQRLTEYSCE